MPRRETQRRQLAESGHQDSDIIHINVLGQHMICLNSAGAATELLDRRGANYCDRPRFTLFEV